MLLDMTICSARYSELCAFSDLPIILLEANIFFYGSAEITYTFSGIIFFSYEYAAREWLSSTGHYGILPSGT